MPKWVQRSSERGRSRDVRRLRWTAIAACKNVSDAFAPAVQALLKKAASHARFKTLAKQ